MVALRRFVRTHSVVHRLPTAISLRGFPAVVVEGVRQETRDDAAQGVADAIFMANENGTKVVTRMVTGMVVLIGVALALMTIPDVRQIGTSLLTVFCGFFLATIVAVPLGIYCLSVLGMYDYLVRFDPVSLLCAIGAAVLLVAGVWMAFAGVSLTISVVVVALAPVFIVIVDEAFRVPRRAQALVDMGLDAVVS